MKTHLIFMRLSAVIIVSVHLGTVAESQTLFNENFSYPPNSLLISNGWMAHSAAGSNPVKVHYSGLSFPGYPSSDIGFSAILNNTGEDVNKSFTPVSTGILYFAFLVKVDTITNDYFFNIGRISMGTTYRGKIYTDGTGKNYNFGLSLGSNTPDYTIGKPYDTASVYLIVLKYSFLAGIQNDAVSLFVFSDKVDEEEPAIPTIGPLADASVEDVSNLGTLALRQYSPSQNILIDGIRVATKWEDAVGSPTFNQEAVSNDNPVLYPVPATEELIVSNIRNFNSIEIFDFSGRKIISVETYSREAINLQIGDLPKGLYLVKLKNKQFFKTRMFIKS